MIPFMTLLTPNLEISTVAYCGKKELGVVVLTLLDMEECRRTHAMILLIIRVHC